MYWALGHPGANAKGRCSPHPLQGHHRSSLSLSCPCAGKALNFPKGKALTWAWEDLGFIPVSTPDSGASHPLSLCLSFPSCQRGKLVTPTPETSACWSLQRKNSALS